MLDADAKQRVNEVKNYSYDLIRDGVKTQFITVSNPAAGAIYERRGFAYRSAIDHLTANPDEVIFRVVEIADQRIELVYVLRTSVRVNVGIGVARTFGPYAIKTVSEGMLIIDAETHIPLEHRGGRTTETLSNYIEIREGCYVPLRIQISKCQLDCTFKVHKPGLWLLDRARREGSATKPLATIAHVRLNGSPGVNDGDNK